MNHFLNIYIYFFPNSWLVKFDYLNYRKLLCCVESGITNTKYDKDGKLLKYCNGLVTN